MNKERIGIVNKVVDDIGEMMSEHELTPDRALEVLKIATMIELIQALELLKIDTIRRLGGNYER